MEVISFKQQDHCVSCNTDRVMELYDAYNKPISYSYFLDNIKTVDMGIFDKRELSYFKCKKCGMLYPITWENTIPEPLINKNILYIFMNNIFKNPN